jgi:spermidine synthase
VRVYFAFVLGVFALTLFVSATLLFLVQPMIGKMILPLLGGSPAVWNTCMVFFQGALLAGYLYVHITTTWLGIRRQALLHAGLLLLPALFLPLTIHKGWSHANTTGPVTEVFSVLLMSVGLPFFVISTSAPLLQKWFASTSHPAATDPYFLYGASNLGSILALLSYPSLVEPHLPLLDQSRLWTAGYFALVVLTLACAVLALRGLPASAPTPPGAATPADSSTAPLFRDRSRNRLIQRWRWVSLAFVPSSLMLGVTTYLTTDIAAIPLLWVLPLVLYLLSFILVFARLPRSLGRAMILAMPPLALLLFFMMLSGTRAPFWRFWMTGVLHLVVLFVAAMVCHGELARSRPATHRLTEFYLWMSLGGVLGGLFNVLVAPVVFSTVAEYPLALFLACLLLPRTGREPTTRWNLRLDVALPAALGVLAIALLSGLVSISVSPYGLSRILHWTPDQVSARIRSFLDFEPVRLNTALRFAIPLALCYAFAERPTQFGLGVGAILAASAWCTDAGSAVLHRERSFFGVLTVDSNDKYRRLVHGNIVHGMQSREPDRRREPLTYYHRNGPIGQVFETFSGPKAKDNVALIGLGTGTLAAYGERGQKFTFYEIDRAVLRIARDARYFTYLRDAKERGVELDVILGDARIRLGEAPDGHYALLIVDAFSSDAIPIHLLTREALDLYFRKLEKGGILAVHISNGYLDLEPVLGKLAEAGELAGLVQSDGANQAGKSGSHWVVLARRSEDFGELAENQRWQRLEGGPASALWTDDYSNLISVFRWRN